MPIEIQIDTSGLEVPKKQLKVFEFRLRNMGPGFRRGAKLMDKQIKTNFLRQSGARKFGARRTSGWKPNKPSTIKAKGHSTILIGGGRNKGKLKRSVRSKIRPKKLIIEYNAIGQFHMDGHTKGLFPPRPFAFPTHANLQKIVDFVSAYIIFGKR